MKLSGSHQMRQNFNLGVQQGILPKSDFPFLEYHLIRRVLIIMRLRRF